MMINAITRAYSATVSTSAKPIQRPPAWSVVAGDVNSTVACTLAAVKLGIPVAHLEAGLRSGDRAMPEEINRIVTDSIADLLWTPSEDGDENLRREGVPEERIERVGNIMIDSYELLRPAIEAEGTRARFGLDGGDYAVLTLHRPSNVDSAEDLAPIVDVLRALAPKVPIVFPVHPRTRQRLSDFGLLARLETAAGLHLVKPLSYLPFMGLLREARLVITDSGGLQEETTYLGIPCLTMRDTTERPITVTLGTNRLVRCEDLEGAVEQVLASAWPKGACPELWDGHTADRVAVSLKRRLGV
ncbi:MAG: non-hydrolyzing UDP-N-acetylglucosamine 2-epimerase [Kiloniellaceae bacterium]